MTTAMVKVGFHGDEIDVCERDGHAWVSVKRMCENMGLEFSAQTRRLERQRWATVAMMATVGLDGKTREVLMLRLDKVPMWLGTIEVSRVKCPVAAKRIELYQDEAADVLAKHFLRKPAAAVGAWDKRLLDTLANHLAVLRSRFPGAWTIVSAVATDVLVLEAVLHEHNLPTSQGDLPDGSVGLCYSHERERLRLGPAMGVVPLMLPDRGEVLVKVYPAAEREVFEAWLAREYMPKKLPAYLGRKPSLKCVKEPLAVASAANRACWKLANRPAELPERTHRELVARGGLVRAG